MDPVLTRRSIRKYIDQPISNNKLEILLKAAMAAHSADDERPWHFLVIKDEQIREQVSEIHPSAYMVTNAPVIIIICGDKTLQKLHGFWVQDCSAATENILIEAKQLGIGSVWLGIYPIEGRVESFRRLLDIPEHVIPFALVALGYPGEYKKPIERFDKTRVHYDKW